jgi:predicted DNA-binding antitoxin AbrB/MazE fold protein
MVSGEVMATVIKAIFEGGVLEPEEPVELEERKHYLIRIEPAAEAAQGEIDDDPTGWQTARRFIGLWKDAPAADLAEKHDKYISRLSRGARCGISSSPRTTSSSRRAQ